MRLPERSIPRLRPYLFCVAPIRNKVKLFRRDAALTQPIDKPLAQTDHRERLAVSKGLEGARQPDAYAALHDAGGKRGIGGEVGQLHDERSAF